MTTSINNKYMYNIYLFILCICDNHEFRVTERPPLPIWLQKSRYLNIYIFFFHVKKEKIIIQEINNLYDF